MVRAFWRGLLSFLLFRVSYDLHSEKWHISTTLFLCKLFLLRYWKRLFGSCARHEPGICYENETIVIVTCCDVNILCNTLQCCDDKC